jgi:hypothetical protein
MGEDGFYYYATFLDDERVTHERYEEIPAKTMWEMTDEVNDGKERLLFLTDKEAELRPPTENISKLMNNGFEFNSPPKLLIVLQHDGMFRRSAASCGRFRPKNQGDPTEPIYWERTLGSFTSPEEALEAEKKLDNFMLEVLIPLALQTNAMVICDAIAEFELSASFLRMVSVQRAKFSDGLPFTIVALTDKIQCLYNNEAAKCPLAIGTSPVAGLGQARSEAPQACCGGPELPCPRGQTS